LLFSASQPMHDLIALGGLADGSVFKLGPYYDRP
jgi:hypothetical protein